MNEWSDLLEPSMLDTITPSADLELLRHALVGRQPPAPRRVFTNRTLRMEKIRHIGFDLDWTLADYHHDAMSQLAFEMAIERLARDFNYPQQILKSEFRSDFCRRGLILDTEIGTVLKMNRHRYVGRAYHGHQYLEPPERSRLYRQEPINPNSKRFRFMDTLFELPEVNIYSELTELKRRGITMPTYPQISKDVRKAIDSIHADGTLKARILGDLERYLPRGPELVLALKRMALGGKRLMLITNSEWYYTQGLCSYMFDGVVPGLSSWRDLFDLVIVSARKPGFFRKPTPFQELDDQGQFVKEVDEPRWGGLYAGGSRAQLMDMLGCPGEQVLYVGDHIYGDIVSSKLTSTWRTALVVKELEEELAVRRELSAQLRHLAVLREEVAEFGQRMDDLDDVVSLCSTLTSAEGRAPDLQNIHQHSKTLRQEHRAMRHHIHRLQRRISLAINPYWGSLFKQGSNKSLFGSQVDDFACVYTSRVHNFAFYGSNHYFRVLKDPMMHEEVL